MAKFKVGDRVNVVWTGTNYFGVSPTTAERLTKRSWVITSYTNGSDGFWYRGIDCFNIPESELVLASETSPTPWDNKIKVCQGQKENEPKVGDLFIRSQADGIEKRYKIAPCTCAGGGPTQWPQGTGCGAHLIPEGETKSIGSICWAGGTPGYWTMDGWLIRANHSSPVMTKATMDKESLRLANTVPGAKTCVHCRGALKKPFPMDPTYNHCPVCEP
jgi:hypothetical protein